MFTVTDVELKRLRDAFKRTSGLSVYMTQQCFFREVLGDGVPPKVAEVSQALIKKNTFFSAVSSCFNSFVLVWSVPLVYLWQVTSTYLTVHLLYL